MSKLQYGYVKTTSGVHLSDVVSQMALALKEEGFGILTDIDLKETLKETLGFDHRQYRILGVCHPALAQRAIETEPHIGMFLPTNVVIQEFSEGRIAVSIANPKQMFKLAGNHRLDGLVSEVDRRLRRVLEAISVSARIPASRLAVSHPQ